MLETPATTFSGIPKGAPLVPKKRQGQKKNVLPNPHDEFQTRFDKPSLQHGRSLGDKKNG
jgi:hypothetical protein